MSLLKVPEEILVTRIFLHDKEIVSSLHATCSIFKRWILKHTERVLLWILSDRYRLNDQFMNQITPASLRTLYFSTPPSYLSNPSMVILMKKNGIRGCEVFSSLLSGVIELSPSTKAQKLEFRTNKDTIVRDIIVLKQWEYQSFYIFCTRQGKLFCSMYGSNTSTEIKCPFLCENIKIDNHHAYAILCNGGTYPIRIAHDMLFLDCRPFVGITFISNGCQPSIFIANNNTMFTAKYKTSHKLTKTRISMPENEKITSVHMLPNAEYMPRESYILTKSGKILFSYENVYRYRHILNNHHVSKMFTINSPKEIIFLTYSGELYTFSHPGDPEDGVVTKLLANILFILSETPLICIDTKYLPVTLDKSQKIKYMGTDPIF